MALITIPVGTAPSVSMGMTHGPSDKTTIVVGVDGSADSDAALEWAIAEGRETHRPLLLVHAVSISESLVLVPFTLFGFPDSMSYGAEVLSRTLDRCRRAGVAASSRLTEGSPAECLIEISDGASMLVLGARGHGEVATGVLGSVSHDCIRHERCPVVIVKRLPGGRSDLLQGQEREVRSYRS